MVNVFDRFPSLANLNEVEEINVNSLRRAYSDNHVNIGNDEEESTLTVSTNRTNIGEKIIVSWKLTHSPSPKDWLGLYYADATSVDNYIDKRVKNVGKSKIGSFTWYISKDSQYKEVINVCVFKYFNGIRGECLATTNVFTICCPLSMLHSQETLPMAIPGVDDLLSVSISDIKACNIKKNFFGKPNPYVKINVLPRVRHLAASQKHHGHQGKSTTQQSTVDPEWVKEGFKILATAADLLEIEVRNKSKARPAASKFLGKLVFPISTMIESCGMNKNRKITQYLIGRTTADKIQGTFTFILCIKRTNKKAEYTYPRLSKRISATSIAPDSTIPIPGPEPHNGTPKEASHKRRPIFYHPQSSQNGSTGLTRVPRMHSYEEVDIVPKQTPDKPIRQYKNRYSDDLSRHTNNFHRHVDDLHRQLTDDSETETETETDTISHFISPVVSDVHIQEEDEDNSSASEPEYAVLEPENTTEHSVIDSDISTQEHFELNAKNTTTATAATSMTVAAVKSCNGDISVEDICLVNEQVNSTALCNTNVVPEADEIVSESTSGEQASLHVDQTNLQMEEDTNIQIKDSPASSIALEPPTEELNNDNSTDQEDDGYVEVEHEFTHDEISLDSSDSDNNARFLEVTGELIRVNSCQQLLQQDDSDAESNTIDITALTTLVNVDGQTNIASNKENQTSDNHCSNSFELINSDNNNTTTESDINSISKTIELTRNDKHDFTDLPNAINLSSSFISTRDDLASASEIMLNSMPGVSNQFYEAVAIATPKPHETLINNSDIMNECIVGDNSEGDMNLIDFCNDESDRDAEDGNAIRLNTNVTVKSVLNNNNSYQSHSNQSDAIDSKDIKNLVNQQVIVHSIEQPSVTNVNEGKIVNWLQHTGENGVLDQQGQESKKPQHKIVSGLLSSGSPVKIHFLQPQHVNSSTDENQTSTITTLVTSRTDQIVNSPILTTQRNETPIPVARPVNNYPGGARPRDNRNYMKPVEVPPLLLDSTEEHPVLKDAWISFEDPNETSNNLSRTFIDRFATPRLADLESSQIGVGLNFNDVQNANSNSSKHRITSRTDVPASGTNKGKSNLNPEKSTNEIVTNADIEQPRERKRSKPQISNIVNNLIRDKFPPFTLSTNATTTVTITPSITSVPISETRTKTCSSSNVQSSSSMHQQNSRGLITSSVSPTSTNPNTGPVAKGPIATGPQNSEGLSKSDPIPPIRNKEGRRSTRSKKGSKRSSRTEVTDNSSSTRDNNVLISLDPTSSLSSEVSMVPSTPSRSQPQQTNEEVPPPIPPRESNPRRIFPPSTESPSSSSRQNVPQKSRAEPSNPSSKVRPDSNVPSALKPRHPRFSATSSSTPADASGAAGSNISETPPQPPSREPQSLSREHGTRSSTRTRQTAKMMNKLSSSSGRSGSSSRSGNEDRFPSNWEKAVDSHGRVYYIDHKNRTTTWHRPRNDAPTLPDHNVNEQLEQLDRRYQSLRRTIRAGRRTGEIPESSSVAESTTSSTTTSTPTTGHSTVSVPSRQTETTAVTGTTATNASATSTTSTAISDNSRSSQQQANSTTNSTPTSATTTTALSRRPSTSAERRVTDAPGCLFIRRRDFYQFVSNHTMANQFFQRNLTLKQIISKVRQEPVRFDRYQHSRDVVTLLNFFANDTGELPPGWEKKTDQYGQSYFVDHTRRSTTFIDPRLPLEETSSRSRHRAEASPSTNARESSPSASSAGRRNRANSSQQQQQQQQHQREACPLATATTTTTTIQEEERVVPKTYDEKVVAFLRQPALNDLLKRRDADLSSKASLQRKISFIKRDGVDGLKRLQNDVELVIMLSLFEDEISSYVPHKEPSTDSMRGLSMVSGRTPAPYRRDFESKIRMFHKQMVTSGYGQGPGKIRLKIRRNHVLEDAFENVTKLQPRSLQKEKLYIKFTGEEGLDYGGPSREFFFMISRELFNPYYGLFEYSASDTYTLQVSPASRYADNVNNWFRFVGRIIALALIHQHLLDVFFTRTIYKFLLRQPWDLSDLETIDPEYHQSMTWLLENDITDMELDQYFSVSEEVFGHNEVTERELKPNGKNILVTEDNKREYIDLVIKWKIERGMGEQMNQLIKGFSEALDLKMISMFDDRELELVIAGTADIDKKDWRKNTEYRSGYHDRHQVVQWFWSAVDSFTNERRLRLLQFVTGTSSIPYEGFSALRGSTGLKKFTIDCWGTEEMLPRAHTCFNRLDLPPYKDYNTLLEKLLYAIEETSAFGIEHCSHSSIGDVKNYVAMADYQRHLLKWGITDCHHKLPADINSFLIGCEIGHSSFGSSTVLLAKRRDVPESKLYALRRVEAEKLTAKDLQLLQHEIELSTKLRHPNICQFLSSFVVDGGFIFFVYPLSNYSSCHDVIATEFKHGLPVTMVAIVLRCMLLALEYLHKIGIIHRAIKASHILLDSSGGVCLTGLRYSYQPPPGKVAHDYPDHGLHMLAWIAPEILQQNVNGYTTSSDIYSLGITAVELVTGTVPYSKLRPTEILLQKIKGVVPQLPDPATIEEMHCDLSTSQTSLDGLEQTNDMMSTPSHQSINTSLKQIRSLQQFVDICVQTDPRVRPTASQLKSSTYIRHIKRKQKEKDFSSFSDLLKNVNSINEFVQRTQCSSEMELVLEKVPSVALDDGEDDGWIF